jgi:hypothetical protein
MVEGIMHQLPEKQRTLSFYKKQRTVQHNRKDGALRNIAATYNKLAPLSLTQIDLPIFHQGKVPS